MKQWHSSDAASRGLKHFSREFAFLSIVSPFVLSVLSCFLFQSCNLHACKLKVLGKTKDLARPGSSFWVTLQGLNLRVFVGTPNSKSE